jgi:hypothetical protein
VTVDRSAEPTDAAGTPYPPYVRTSEERRRWDICLRTATAMSELCEPSGVANSQYVWFMTRSFYKSGIPTGTPDDELL